LSRPDRRPPLAAIFGCARTALEEAERRLFAAANPLGLILFARNIENPAQVRRLIEPWRASVGRPDALVLVDHEGGRVARLNPPHWRAAPAAARFGALFAHDPAAAEAATRLNSRLIAAELVELGISVDCLPVLGSRDQ
jgi:beta-N-acetylhexosaminidase